MKEQTFLIEKLDEGFIVTTESKQSAYGAFLPVRERLKENLCSIISQLDNNINATSIEITISHKVHYKAEEPNDDNTGNHGV